MRFPLPQRVLMLEVEEDESPNHCVQQQNEEAEQIRQQSFAPRRQSIQEEHPILAGEMCVFKVCQK